MITIVRKLYFLHEQQSPPEGRRRVFDSFAEKINHEERERYYEQSIEEALHIVHKQHESDDLNRVANFVWPNVEELVKYIEEEISF